MASCSEYWISPTTTVSSAQVSSTSFGMDKLWMMSYADEEAACLQLFRISALLNRPPSIAHRAHVLVEPKCL